MGGKYQKVVGLVGGGWAVRVVWLACIVRLLRVDRAVRLVSVVRLDWEVGLVRVV